VSAVSTLLVAFSRIKCAGRSCLSLNPALPATVSCFTPHNYALLSKLCALELLRESSQSLLLPGFSMQCRNALCEVHQTVAIFPHASQYEVRQRSSGAPSIGSDTHERRTELFHFPSKQISLIASPFLRISKRLRRAIKDIKINYIQFDCFSFAVPSVCHERLR